VDGVMRGVGCLRALPPRPGIAAGLVVLVLVSGLIVAGAAGSSAAGSESGTTAPADACTARWVTAWQASPQAAPGGHLDGRTLRMPVRPQAGGPELRVRLSNRYGDGSLVVGSVAAARSAGGAAVETGTTRTVTFAGRPEVVVPRGADVVSDPVPLPAEAGLPLALSVFLDRVPDTVTEHPVALQTSYLSRPGDFARVGEAAPFEIPVRSWPVLAGVDVLAPRPVNAVVLVGDSITDGVGSGVDADERWSDALARRLAEAGGTERMAVLNAGISGNQLLADRPGTAGDSPLRRFDADVARAAGVTDVVLHIGTNDIAAGRAPGEIADGLARFAERARAAGLRVFLTTVAPAGSGPHGTADAIATRDAVNSWVREHGRGQADGVFDLAAVVADPARPHRLAAQFDSGDGLHLSAAGYRALAGAVPDGVLTGSPCLGGAEPGRALLSAR
jgi:lysophospholipase L1-like esterase